MLRQRIERSPREINDIFASMLGEMDELHKSSFAFYVSMMQLIEEMGVDKYDNNVFNSIAVISAAKLQKTKFDWATLSEMCERTQLQILARTMGLLTCPQGPSDPPSRYHSEMQIRAKPKKRPGEPVFYQAQTVSWVHRSAYDFLRDPAVFNKLDIRPISTARLLRRLALGAVEYYTAPQHCGRNQELYRLVESLGLVWNICPRPGLEALDRLQDVVATGPHKGRFNPSDLWSSYGEGAPLEYLSLRFGSIEASQLLDIFSGLQYRPLELMSLDQRRLRFVLTSQVLEAIWKQLAAKDCLPLENSQYTFIYQEKNGRDPKWALHFSYCPSRGWHVGYGTEATICSIVQHSWRDHSTKRDRERSQGLGSDTLYQECSLTTMEEYQFVGACLGHYFERNWDSRLELQLVTNIPAGFYQIEEDQELTNTGYTYPGSGSSPNEACLQFVCLPWPTNMRHRILRDLEMMQCIIFRPSHEAAERLPGYIRTRYVFGTQNLELRRQDLGHCLRLVEKSIQENKQKLSATDQSLLLACIQVWFHRLFDGLEDFHVLFGSRMGVIPKILEEDGFPDLLFAKDYF
ncbi:hypothetical protein PG996_013987 [Apiospora saccharicola]|uniref:Uncharacterized protein n=1 Tax=Apiospora saccharicola TaxID=335842 RepID=A0ABR1TH09_9PEZI